MPTRFTTRTRLLSCLLTLAMLLSLVPVSASAESSADVAINEENFPDSAFREYVSSEFDTDHNGSLSQEEIAKVTKISSYGSQVHDLTGIGFFTNLTELYFYNSQLTELDLSGNTALEWLSCSGNALKKLNVSKNKALRVIYCYNNQLTELDVSQNAALEWLSCSNNQLTELDVSQNAALEELNCSGNPLTKLDVSQNAALKKLYCDRNDQLTELDVSQNAALEELSCSDSQLTKLDVSQNAALKRLYCYRNDQLTELDVSRNAALEWLSCSDNPLTELDVSQNLALKTLYCNSNQLTKLDVSQNTALIQLHCESNQLTTLDASGSAALETLDCSNNQLTTLELRQKGSLTKLNCSNNQLTELDVSAKKYLETLDCSNNQLTKLDVSRNTELGTLNCSGNQLSYLNLSENGNLYDFNFNNDDNRYLIQLTENNTFDLHDLPGDLYSYFDSSKASNWKGGTVKGYTLTVEPGAKTVTYTYKCSDRVSADFTLDVNGYHQVGWVVHEGEQPSGGMQVPGAIGDEEDLVRFVGWYTEDGTRLEDTPYFTTENGGPHIEAKKLTEDITFYARWCEESELQTLNFEDCTVTINPEMTTYGIRNDLTSPAKVAAGARVTLTMDSDKASEGAKFAIKPTPADWEDNGTTAAFTMPNQDVTVSVVASATPDPDTPATYSLTFEDCTVEVDGTAYTESPIEVAAGAKVTLKLDESRVPGGMKFNGFVINPLPAPDEMKTEGTTTTFTMPDQNVSVYVNFCTEEEESTVDFGAVLLGTAAVGAAGLAVYHFGTEIVLEKLLPEGTAIPKTKGELALLLWNEAGRPEDDPVSEVADLADIADPDMAKAVQWAVDNGVMTRNEDGTFHADKRISKIRVIRSWKEQHS